MRGSIVKRGKSYSYVLYLGRDDAGKKRQKWVGGFRTKREAESALTQALERPRTGAWGDPGRQTLGDYLLVWLAAARPSLRETTAASYEVTLTCWIIPRIGSVRLAALTPAHLSTLYAELSRSGRRDGGGLSPRSVRYTHSILSHALKDATAWGLLARNPATLVDPPRQQPAEMRVWTHQDVQRFLAHVADDRLYSLWALLVASGLRRGEALGLRWTDIDLERGTLAIRRALVVVGYAVQVAEPKTARGRRLVTVDPVTAAALVAWRDQQQREAVAADAVSLNSGYVFTDEIGRPLHPQRVSVIFRRLVKEAGLPAIRLHDLRHTSATLALTAGIHPKVVSERLGHSAIGITMDTYSHVVGELQAEAARKMAALIYPTPAPPQ